MPKKRLIVCCDGTWDMLSDPYPTNIVKLARAFRSEGKDGILQLVYYDEGLGSNSILDRLPGATFGTGIDRDICDAYAFLCMNYCPGDEIYLFGFSRGAYTVRCLSRMVGDYGILKRSAMRLIPKVYWHYRLVRTENKQIQLTHIDWVRVILDTVFKQGNAFCRDFKRIGLFNKRALQEFLASWEEEMLPRYVHEATRSRSAQDKTAAKTMNLLACFDTVGQVGIPDVFGFIPLDRWFGRLGFHDNQVNRQVCLALHAVALNEHRRFLRNTPMEASEDSGVRLKQCWFPGHHECVGGGNAKNGLYQMANVALDWMLEEFDPDETFVNRGALHELNDDFPDDSRSNPLVDFHPLGEFQGIAKFLKLFTIVYRRPIPEETAVFEPDADVPNQFHPSAIERLVQREEYRDLLFRDLSNRQRRELEDCIALQRSNPDSPTLMGGNRQMHHS